MAYTIFLLSDVIPRTGGVLSSVMGDLINERRA